MRLFVFLIALMPATAWAADRTIAVGSFDRLRVEGPFDVRVSAGSPGARIVGDRSAAERIDIRLEGTTLIVRAGSGGWGERPRQNGGEAPRIILSTPSLGTISAMGGAMLAVDRLKGQRIDLSLSGAGAIAVTQIDADQLNATVIGAGGMTLAGRAARARLLTNGPGSIDAGGLVVKDLDVRLEGLGETKAQACYTATVTNSGLGRVTVTGGAKCVVKAAAGGPVTCGP